MQRDGHGCPVPLQKEHATPGAKAELIFWALTARLKSCADTKAKSAQPLRSPGQAGGCATSVDFAAGRSPLQKVGAKSARSCTPASRRTFVTWAAILAKPGVSLWMHRVSARNATSEPFRATTFPCTMVRACCAASAGSWMSASECLRERSVPSGS